MQCDLFDSSKGIISSSSLRSSLFAIGADQADILYIHSDMNLGVPNPNIRRNQMLEIIFEQILSLGVKTIFFPTYTFSFCNGENYDPANSRSYMGALNEYARKRNDVYRSMDPLMSVCAFGYDLGPVKDIEKESIGLHSTFDLLSAKSRVKYLFLGPRLGSCFTFMHYLEWKACVPYRYNRPFSGLVVDNNRLREDTYDLFVRYRNVLPNDNSFIYEEILLKNNKMSFTDLGNGGLSLVDQEIATDVYLDLLKRDMNFFIQEPFDRNKVDDSFYVKQMRAL